MSTHESALYSRYPLRSLVLYDGLTVVHFVLGGVLLLVALLAFRFFYVFPRVSCVHCRAKNACPNARSMGLS